MAFTEDMTLEDEFREEQVPRHYSNQELQDFWDWLQPFREEKELHKLGDFKVLEKEMVLNVQKAAVAFGALRHQKLPYESYAVILERVGEGRDKRAIYKKPTKWDIFLDKLEQAQALQGKRDFAQQKQLEEYERIAAEDMTVVNEGI